MKKYTLFILNVVMWTVLFLMLASIAGAQNPCDAPKPIITFVTSASVVTATVPNFGTTQIVDLDVAVFPSGSVPLPDSPPLFMRTVPKSGWTLAFGTADCYMTSAAFLMTQPKNAVFDLWVRANSPTAKGTWAGGSGAVPFVVQDSGTAPTPVPGVTECLDGISKFKAGYQHLWKWRVAEADAKVNELADAGWVLTSVRVTTTYWWWTGICGG